MKPAPEDKWVDVGGLRIHCLAAGHQGSQVLLLHGGGLDCASLSWKHTIVPISASHRVLAPDWPGYGESDKPDVEYSVEYYVEFLGRLLDALGLEKVSLVGISMGGGASLGLTLRFPQRVGKLILVDSYGLGGELPWPLLSYAVVHAPLLNELTWRILALSRRLIKTSLRGIIHDPRVVDEELVDEVYQLMRKPGAGRAFRSFQRSEATRHGLRTNYVDQLEKIAVPTLVVHGAEDRLVPVAWARRAHRLIKDSVLRTIEDCGHWPPRERPDEFNQALLEFLAEDR